MKLSKVRRYRKRHRLIAALFARNPVLVVGLNLPFLIATSVGLRAAAALSLELLLVHLGTMVAALIAARFCPRSVRPVVCVVVSTLLMVAARLWLISLFRGIVDSLGMYIYLMAVNGMTLAQTAEVTADSHPAPVLGRAFLNVLAFSVVMFLFSLFRELAGNGTLWGIAVSVPLRLSGVTVPFFGFILAGFFLAGANVLNKQLLALALRERALREARFSVVREQGTRR